MTNPSRSLSKGRLLPTDDSAVMLLNPASDDGVAAASLPPLMMASHRPMAISRAA